MYEDDPVKDSIGFGGGIVATLAQIALRLGQRNVASGAIIGIGWLITGVLFMIGYSIVSPSLGQGGAYVTANAESLSFGNCMTCLSGFGCLLMLPMSLGWLVNSFLGLGNRPAGAKSRSGPPPTAIAAAKDKSKGGLATGEQIKWDE